MSLFSCTMVVKCWRKMHDLKIRSKLYYWSAWGKIKDPYNHFSGIVLLLLFQSIINEKRMFCLQNLFFMIIKMSFLAKHEEYWLWKIPLYVKIVFEYPVFYFLPQLCELMTIICTWTTRVAIIKLLFTQLPT